MKVVLLGNYPPDQQWSMRRFTEQLRDALTAQGVSVEIYLPKVLVGRLGAKPHGFGKWLGYIDKYLLTPLHLRKEIRKLPANTVLHICDHSNAIYTKALKKTPHLVTCHDLLAVRSALGEIPENRTKWSGKIQQSMILRGLKRARVIVSVSDATRRDVSRLVGAQERWHDLIPNALDDAFIKEATNDSTDPVPPPNDARLYHDRPYVLHIGGEKWYKNRKAVLRIFRQLQAENKSLQLLVVGPEFSDTALEASGCLSIRKQIHYLRGISDSELRTLYRGAEILLFPSLMEGFGWPILEAQACGCPVASYAREPMGALNALAELTADIENTRPGDAEASLAEVCLAQLKLPENERMEQKNTIQQFAAQFTNEASARAYLHIYRELLGHTESA
jgi:glycosyltransferase involved in cell wall biosynthesis